MGAGQQAVADHGVFVHPDQATGLPHAAALGDVGEHRDDFVLRQAAVEQRGAFALGKPGLAALAIQQPALLAAIPATHGQIAVSALAVVGAVSVLTAKGREIIHDNSSLESIPGAVKNTQLL